jgi:8-oxo-dGTP pyrophosphatase MutT (NUDIX family)
VQVDFNDVCGGRYDWREIKSVIEKECGWVAPETQDKGLHTSCQIEKCKEYSQFKRFYEMRSDMIPFSALEISLASRDRNLSREAALRELKEELGVTAEPADLVCCGDRYIVWDDVFFGKPYHDRQYTRVFLMWTDLEEDGFVLQKEEVDSVLWMDFEQCIEGVKNNSFENCIAVEELNMVKEGLMKGA